MPPNSRDQVMNRPAPPPPEPSCPECGSLLRDSHAARCWYCREGLESANPFRLKPSWGGYPLFAIFGIFLSLSIGVAVLDGLLMVVLVPLSVVAILRFPPLFTSRAVDQVVPFGISSLALSFFSGIGMLFVGVFVSFLVVTLVVLAFSLLLNGLDQMAGLGGDYGPLVFVGLLVAILAAVAAFLLRARSRRKR